jgi:hypothetical protein
MRFITEVAEDIKFLVEKKEDGGKNVFIEGIFAQYDKQNKNGRIYPKSVMEKEIERYQDVINAKRALGELGHPANPSINLDKASHLITMLKMEGKGSVMGKAKILETPMGIIARNLIENGVQLGVSTRGLGSLKEKNGVNEVQDDFHLATVDIVADPSAPDAFVQGIYESAEWVCENGVWKAIDIEKAQKALKESSKAKLDETKLKIFEAFLSQLK